jgi:hypothetical protein
VNGIMIWFKKNNVIPYGLKCSHVLDLLKDTISFFSFYFC